MERMYSLTDVSRILHISRDSVRILIANGELDAYKVRARLKIAPADLAAYLASAREAAREHANV